MVVKLLRYFTVVALASACWEESAVLDLCVQSGRCRPPLALDAGSDAGTASDAAVDAGFSDAGSSDAGAGDAGARDAGPDDGGARVNGAVCSSDDQCASGACTGTCARWSRHSSGGGSQFFGAMAALPTGGLLLGGSTTGDVFLGSTMLGTSGNASFWLTTVPFAAQLLPQPPLPVVDVAWTDSGATLLCSAGGSAQLFDARGSLAYAPITATSFIKQNEWLLAGATPDSPPRAVLFGSSSQGAPFARDAGADGGPSDGDRVTRVAVASGSVVVGGWFTSPQLSTGTEVLNRRASLRDAFVVKRGAGFVRHFWAGHSAGVKSLLVMPDGGFLVGFEADGEFYEDAQVAPRLPALGLSYVVLARLAADGSTVWLHALGRPVNSATFLGGLALSARGELAVVGQTSSTAGLQFEDGGALSGSGTGVSGYVLILDANSGATLGGDRFSCASSSSSSPDVNLLGVAFDAVTQGVLVGGQANCSFNLGDGEAGSLTKTHIFWGNLGRWW